MNPACLLLLYASLGMTTLPEGFQSKSFRERERFKQAVYHLAEFIDPRPFIVAGTFRVKEQHAFKEMRELWEWYETPPMPVGEEYPVIAKFTPGCRVAYSFWEQARIQVSQAVSDEHYDGVYERIYRASSCCYVRELFRRGLTRYEVIKVVRKAYSHRHSWIEPMTNVP